MNDRIQPTSGQQSGQRTRSRPSGIQQPPAPPSSADAYDAALYYVDHYEREFSRARRVVKGRSSRVLIAAGLGNLVVVILGGVITTWSGLSWLGILSSGFAAAVGTLVAWDNHFKHRDLWVQRSDVLQRCNEIRRNMELDARLGKDRDAIAVEAMTALNRVLRYDIDSWKGIRGNKTPIPTQEDVEGRTGDR
jgi:hypothetical protein